MMRDMLEALSRVVAVVRKLLAILLVRLAVPWRGLAGAAMEPLIYALGVGIAVCVALLAGLPAARRAASVEPMVAMRSE